LKSLAVAASEDECYRLGYHRGAKEALRLTVRGATLSQLDKWLARVRAWSLSATDVAPPKFVQAAARRRRTMRV
jgi:hypothetical protein